MIANTDPQMPMGIAAAKAAPAPSIPLPLPPTGNAPMPLPMPPVAPLPPPSGAPMPQAAPAMPPPIPWQVKSQQDGSSVYYIPSPDGDASKDIALGVNPPPKLPKAMQPPRGAAQ